MAKKTTRSERITLRLTPKVYGRLVDAARDYRLSVNAVLELMLSRYLGELSAEAALFQRYWELSAREVLRPLLQAWEAKHPEAGTRGFMYELRNYAVGRPSALDELEVPGKPT